MPIATNAQQLDIDAASMANILVIGGCGAVRVRGIALGALHQLIDEVDVTGKYAADGGVIRLLMEASQPHVFIEEEGATASETHLPALTAGGEFLIHRYRSRTRGQAQGGPGVGIAGEDIGGGSSHLCWCGTDEDVHAVFPNVNQYLSRR